MQSGKWIVQVGKGSKGSYKTTYAFPATESVRAKKWYAGINIHSGYKKRLIDPNGNIYYRSMS